MSFNPHALTACSLNRPCRQANTEHLANLQVGQARSDAKRQVEAAGEIVCMLFDRGENAIMARANGVIYIYSEAQSDFVSLFDRSTYTRLLTETSGPRHPNWRELSAAERTLPPLSTLLPGYAAKRHTRFGYGFSEEWRAFVEAQTPKPASSEAVAAGGATSSTACRSPDPITVRTPQHFTSRSLQFSAVRTPSSSVVPGDHDAIRFGADGCLTGQQQAQQQRPQPLCATRVAAPPRPRGLRVSHEFTSSPAVVATSTANPSTPSIINLMVSVPDPEAGGATRPVPSVQGLIQSFQAGTPANTLVQTSLPVFPSTQHDVLPVAPTLQSSVSQWRSAVAITSVGEPSMTPGSMKSPVPELSIVRQEEPSPMPLTKDAPSALQLMAADLSSAIRDLPGLIPSPGSAFNLAGSVSRAASTGPDRSVTGESLSPEVAQALANALLPMMKADETSAVDPAAFTRYLQLAGLHMGSTDVRSRPRAQQLNLPIWLQISDRSISNVIAMDNQAFSHLLWKEFVETYPNFRTFYTPRLFSNEELAHQRDVRRER